MKSRGTRMGEVDTNKAGLWVDFAFWIISENGVRKRRRSFGMEPSVIGPDPDVNKGPSFGRGGRTPTAVGEKGLRTVWKVKMLKEGHQLKDL